MGFSQSWVAVKGKSPESILDFLRLKPTSEHEEFPESIFVSMNLEDGWYLVVANKYGGFAPGFLLEKKLIAALEQKNQQLSTDCELVACDLEEHVMVSRISGWKNGQKIWCIFHDAQENIEHLKIDGNPPEIFDKIRNRLIDEQEKAGGQTSDVDYFFDIPIELGKTLIGYRHDEDIDAQGDKHFSVLQSTMSKVENTSKPLWRKIFGI